MQAAMGLLLSNSFAAVGRGLALANSIGAFRFQPLRFRASAAHPIQSIMYHHPRPSPSASDNKVLKVLDFFDILFKVVFS